MLHDKLQLKFFCFFLFCYFVYQKLSLSFLVWNKVNKKLKVKTRHVLNEVDSGSGWLMRPVLFESALKKVSKNNAALHPFRFLLLVSYYYLFYTTYSVDRQSFKKKCLNERFNGKV